MSPIWKIHLAKRIPTPLFTIRAKLAGLFLLLFLLPFSVSAMLWYEKSTASIEENAVQTTEQLLMQMNRNLDYYLSDVKKATVPLLTNPIVQQFIRLEPSEVYKQFTVSEQVKLELYPNYVYGRKDVYGFTLLSSKGVYHSNVDISDRIRSYLDLDAGEDNYRYLGISLVQSTPVLTIYRKIYDNTSYRAGGALVIDLLLDPILETIDNVRLGQTGVISIAGADGAYLYHPDRQLWGAPIPARYKERLGSQGQVHFVSDGPDGDQLVIAFRSEFTGLTLISEVPLRELMEKLVFMRNLTVVLGAAMLLFAVIMIVGFSLSITKPLSLLMRLMKKVELGNLQIRAPGRRDEIGRLNEGFNRMLDEIQRLIEIVHTAEIREKEMAIKQRESHLQSLQLRINPHFLYNTLEAINAYAIVAKVKPISQMTVWLSQILRYSISHPEKVVPLAEEMNQAFTYFNIQKERFQDLRLEVELDPEWLDRVRILPLTIQPLVENAFMHGYEKRKRKAEYIGLFGRADPEGYVLRIEDRGLGMPPELAAAYNEAFREVTEQEMLKPDFQRFPRLGLWNVHSRLRLAFGVPYGLTIVRSDERGTVIEIRLPYAERS